MSVSTADPALAQLLAHARHATDVDTAACALLDALQALFLRVGREFSAPPHTVLRGMVHLRPNGSYRHLTVRDWSGDSPRSAEATVPLAPSATLWRFVQGSRQAAVLDVMIAELRIGTAPPIPLEAPDYDAIGEGKSLDAMTVRATTHVIALPVRGQGDVALGMVSMELQCSAAIGRPLPWAAATDNAQLMIDSVAPLLLSLPTARPRNPVSERALPVIGQRMQDVMSVVHAFAPQIRPILLTGQTGSGKSMLARVIHDHSQVAAGPFVSFTVHGMNEDQQLGHLKGWRKGAFPGALDHKGLLETARNGTLFLDEIQNLTVFAQAGLLEMLDKGTYQVLGEDHTRVVDNVRFIVASNADLQREVELGRFRKDLWYRINVLSVELPPLDERRDEITQWASFMARQAHQQQHRDGDCWITAAGLALLPGRHWGGNLRELDNVVSRAHALAAAAANDPRNVEIDVAHLQRAFSRGTSAERDDNVYELLARAAHVINRLSAVDARLGRDSLGDYLRQNNVLYSLLWTHATDEGVLGVEQIARIVGKERSISQRNYAKEFRREQLRLEAFVRRLSEYGTRD